MKKTIVTAVLILTVLANHAQKKDTTLIVEGFYSNKNIFVKNSYGPGGIGFCVTEVKVNGRITKDEINSNIFQVHLDAFDLKTGDKIKVEIKHLKGCAPLTSPLVLNPSAFSDKDSEMLIMEGLFLWQNVFVFNPRTSSGKYSVKEVIVNGKPISEINSDIFEINLTKLGLENEQKIKIEFRHEKLYGPVILNPEAIR
ncbi:MAG: hypothetical protein K0S32_2818 [Bacteroidetes bacterium]|jgi:hypothetical protein|nr:hypothetical protein [Bacteroidota bacterium]